MTRTVLIIGATGGIGSATSAALLARGWDVRALSRDPVKAAHSFPNLQSIDWIAGDALNAGDVTNAGSGVERHCPCREPTQVQELARSGVADVGKCH